MCEHSGGAEEMRVSTQVGLKRPCEHTGGAGDECENSRSVEHTCYELWVTMACQCGLPHRSTEASVVWEATHMQVWEHRKALFNFAINLKILHKIKLIFVF